MPQRIDYDEIAEDYDSDRHRGKTVDPKLLAFLAERAQPAAGSIAILDIGCGTGSQLVANRAQISTGHMVGLDFHLGMVRQARKKTRRIDWLQGDGARLPFATESFDFVTNQFSFHHVQDKSGMISEVYRILRPGGQFVMSNISAHDMPNWIIYRYFPRAWEIDMQDFMPKEAIRTLMLQAGFDQVEIDLAHQDYEEDLAEFADVSRMRVVSQLRTIPDLDYEAGLKQIEAELQQAQGQPVIISSEFTMAKFTGQKI
jgi:ubiquinone/menaquinone biosynthesis C-methylase UbiE